METTEVKIKDDENILKRVTYKDNKETSWVTKSLVEDEIRRGKDTNPWGFYK